MSPDPDGPGAPGRFAGPLTHLLGWLAAGAVATAAAILLLGSGSDPSRSPSGLRPVHEIALVDAMRHARCTLRTTRPNLGSGSPAHVRPGIYDTPLRAATYGGALARGIVVIEYSDAFELTRLDELAAVQRALPAGTIVAPSRQRTRTALRASAYRRVLRCAETGQAALDALALFRGRFVGQAP